jgi:transposase-like protein
MDETYMKVNDHWAYLYRVVDNSGRTVDFYLSSHRNSKAAYRFLGKILNNVKKWQIPRFINTDKAPTNGRAPPCSIVKVGAHLTLNTDRLSTGITLLNVIIAN